MVCDKTFSCLQIRSEWSCRAASIEFVSMLYYPAKIQRHAAVKVHFRFHYVEILRAHQALM